MDQHKCWTQATREAFSSVVENFDLDTDANISSPVSLGIEQHNNSFGGRPRKQIFSKQSHRNLRTLSLPSRTPTDASRARHLRVKNESNMA